MGPGIRVPETGTRTPGPGSRTPGPGPRVPNPRSRIPESTCRFSINKIKPRVDICQILPIHVLNLVHIRLVLNTSNRGFRFLHLGPGIRVPETGTRTPDSGSRTPGPGPRVPNPRSRISESTCRFSINKIKPRVDICQILPIHVLNLVHIRLFLNTSNRGFRFLHLGPGIRVPGSGTWTPGPGLRVPDPGPRTPAPGPRVPNPGSRIPESTCPC